MLPAWMTDSQPRAPGSAPPQPSGAQASSHVQSIEEALAVLERLGGKVSMVEARTVSRICLSLMGGGWVEKVCSLVTVRRAMLCGV